MLALWLVLALAAGAAIGTLVTLRRLPDIISRMSDDARERLLDQVEAIERAEAD